MKACIHILEIHTMTSLAPASLNIGSTYVFVNTHRNRNYGQRIFKGINTMNFLGVDAGLGASFWEPAEHFSVYNLADTYIESIELDIGSAEYIGDLKEGEDIVLKDYMDPILYTEYEDGDECVLVIHPNGRIHYKENCFVYKADSLKKWFDTGSREEPQTRIQIKQSMLRRFTYRC